MKRRITNGKPTPGTLFYRLKQFSRNEMKPGLSCHLKSGRYVTPWGFASHTIRVATPTKSVKLSAHLELRDISDDTHTSPTVDVMSRLLPTRKKLSMTTTSSTKT